MQYNTGYRKEFSAACSAILMQQNSCTKIPGNHFHIFTFSLFCTAQHCIVLAKVHSAELHCFVLAALHCTVQHSVLYFTALNIAEPYTTSLDLTALHYTILHYATQYFSALLCTVHHYSASNIIAPHYTAMHLTALN